MPRFCSSDAGLVVSPSPRAVKQTRRTRSCQPTPQLCSDQRGLLCRSEQRKSTDMADRDFTRTLRRARRLPEYPAHGLRSRAGYWPVITAVRIVLEVPGYNVAFERCGVRGD
jgi:hypothetical protein